MNYIELMNCLIIPSVLLNKTHLPAIENRVVDECPLKQNLHLDAY